MTRASFHASSIWRYSVILFCFFLAPAKIGRIDVFQADKYAPYPRARTLFHEIRQLVTQRIDLDDKADFEFRLLAQIDQAIEDRFPVLVAGKVVIGDEKAAHPLGVIDPDNLFDVVGRAAARFAALDVDDGAERALV